MKLVDAHIHLSDGEYSQKVDDIIEDAKQSNVVALVSNSMDFDTSLLSLRLAEEYPNHVYAALGIHPWNVRNLSPNELQDTGNLIFQHGKRREKVVAVGEIGLDFKYTESKELQDLQLQVFHEMLSIAEKVSLPVIIHSRGTTNQIMSLLPSYGVKKVLLHWFSRPIGLLSQIVDHGYYITEGPPSVFSSGIREIIRRVPLTNLLTETDGPVRFGGPFKGKMTTPSFISLVVEAVAQLKGKKETEVADQIFRNFTNFFGVESVRDKRNGERTNCVEGKTNSLTMEGT
jgi:TatD DNase family protein